MSTSLLCVGTELLLGQIENSNSGFIGRALLDAGIDSFEQRVVGDNPGRIKDTLLTMLHNCDSVIVSGGLGPTHDDFTREVTAELMGVDLVLNKEAEENMRAIFKRRDREMPESNLRQAMVPVGATMILNKLGTAPGLICPLKIKGRHKYIFLVPGFPHELKPMVEEVIIPFILKTQKESHVILNLTLKSWGIPESELNEILEDVIKECENGDAKVGFLARGINGIYIKVSAKSKTRQAASAAIEKVEKQIMALVGDSVYAFNDETMESNIIKIALKKNCTFAVCESFTGGLISSRLVEVSGASDVYKGGLTAYLPEVKKEILNIDFDDVYSLECAKKMASATIARFNCDYALSTTGVAGPESQFVNGVEHKAGEVYIGVASKNNSFAFRFLLGGDRQRVREYGSITAMNMLKKFISDEHSFESDLKEGKSSE